MKKRARSPVCEEKEKEKKQKIIRVLDWQTVEQWLRLVPVRAREKVDYMDYSCEMDSCDGPIDAYDLCWDEDRVKSICSFCCDNYHSEGDCQSCQLSCLEGSEYVEFGEGEEKKLICNACKELILEWNEKKFQDIESWIDENLRDRKDFDLQPVVDSIAKKIKKELSKQVSNSIQIRKDFEQMNQGKILKMVLPATKRVLKRMTQKE